MKDPVELAKNMERRALQRQQTLPLWPDKRRGLPNPIARCALFRVGKEDDDAKRRQMDYELISGSDPAMVHWTGKELFQSDLDVFLQVLHFGRAFKLGEPFIVTGQMILSELGKSDGLNNYIRLRDSVRRMAEGTLWITRADKLSGFNGHLLAKSNWAKQNEEDRHMKWMFKLDEDIAPLFADDMYSRIDWDQRLQLKALAKWLHAFYHTHKIPNPMPAQRIHELCGSKTDGMHHFRANLKKALDELVAVKFLRSWEIDNVDNVFTERTSQGLVIDMES
jgi:hypothetical protein